MTCKYFSSLFLIPSELKKYEGKVTFAAFEKLMIFNGNMIIPVLLVYKYLFDKCCLRTFGKIPVIFSLRKSPFSRWLLSAISDYQICPFLSLETMKIKRY